MWGYTNASYDNRGKPYVIGGTYAAYGETFKIISIGRNEVGGRVEVEWLNKYGLPKERGVYGLVPGWIPVDVPAVTTNRAAKNMLDKEY